MANEEHLRILRQGVAVWNQWRAEHPDVQPDFQKASLRGANLRRADLYMADFCGADLEHANLNLADLREANLSWTNFRNAHLAGANLFAALLTDATLSQASLVGACLSLADLRAADLRWADLNAVNLSSAKLDQADFGETMVGWTVFCGVDLSGAKQLELVRHNAPSSIGIDAIYLSQGRIPEAFLRGAGVPDEFINYVRSLVGRAIEYYSCFISYSTKDQEFAERLHADLQDKGVRCWFAPEDVQGGRKLHEQIEQAIRVYDKLLVVLSEHSMGSEWVKTEIYHARQEEVQRNCRKLFPISLVPFETIREWRAFDADTGKDMGREVREYFVPDFSNWKDHDAYKHAFDRLLRDLKGNSS